MSNILKQSEKMAGDTIKPKAPTSPILIQKDLPQHKMHSDVTPSVAPAAQPPIPSVKEKWSFLKSTLESAVNDWSELENRAPQKTAEEEQLDKMRSLISNIKIRLNDF